MQTTQSPLTNVRLSRKRGQALVELALVAPWLFFLFLSAADLGFCSYAAIGVQNAARAAALYTSSGASAAGDSLGACTVVRQELQSLPNFATTNSTCSASPLQVTATRLANGIDGNPATRVTVTYQTFDLLPVPLLFSGPVTIARTVEMPLRTD